MFDFLGFNFRRYQTKRWDTNILVNHPVRVSKEFKSKIAGILQTSHGGIMSISLLKGLIL
ncbi:MAG: hypothetical protein LBB45_08415 [Methanobrevibacter sp.]|jgi:hypothetical protein|nr:hypothetical protein [Candidatus Methanovirga basalitermitum]